MPNSRNKSKNSSNLEDILHTITSAERVINEVKASGLDISESERLLEQAMSAYKEKDDRKVMFFVKKAEALAKKAWKGYYVKLTEETLSSTRKLIDEVREAGLEPVEAEDLFVHAIELVEKKNFKLAEDYIKKAVAEANKTWNESRAKVVSDAIASIHALIMEAKEIGVDVAEAESILLQAITHYKNEEYEIADDLVKNAVILSRNSWNDYRSQVTSEGISNAYELIMQAKNLGTDISKAEKMLAEAEENYEEHNFDAVEEILKNVEVDLKNRMLDAKSQEISSEMKKISEIIEEARDMNADVTSAEELFKQAQSMYKERDYDSVDDYLKVIETLVDDAKKQVKDEKAAESRTSTETMLREIETKVGDATPDSALTETKKLLDKLKVMGESAGDAGSGFTDELKEKLVAEEDKVPRTVSDETDSYEWGATYLSREPKSQKSFQFFLNLLNDGAKGLCISRMHPEKLEKKYNLKESTIWLSKLPCETCRNPSNLGKLAFTINQYLDQNPSSVILLDGLEYLINNNDFQMVLRFIEDIHESIVIHDAIFIVPVSPASYDERELTLLERNSIALTDGMVSNTVRFMGSQPHKKEITASSESPAKTGKGPPPITTKSGKPASKKKKKGKSK